MPPIITHRLDDSSGPLEAPQRDVGLLPAPAAESPSFDFAYYWFLLYRRRWHILTIALVTTAAISLLTLTLPKKYESTAILRVDPQQRTTVGQTGQNGTGVDPTLLVATEAQVITSPAVIAQLVETQHLAQNPEFAPAGYHGGPLTLLQRDQVLKRVTKAVSVDQPIDTLLLKIGFTCHNPELAAAAANTLSHVYLDHEYATRAQALSDASKNMVEQMDSLRAQMERSQSALVQYESTHDVIDPDDKNNIYKARLSQISTALSAAETARIQLEAEYAVARTGDPDVLAATPPGKALEPLEDRLHAEQNKLAEIGTIYGLRHPLYVQQRKLVQYDQTLLRQTAAHIALRVESQYRSALLREQLIQTAVDREKAAMDDFNMRAIRFHSLQAASNSATQLYYNLQQSIENATVAAGLHSEELRIISPAQPSPIPVFPRPLFYGALSLLASLFLAGAGVIVLGVLDRTVSTPEQVEQRFHCRVLAALPVLDGARQGISPSQYGITGGSDPQLPSRRRNGFEEAILALHSAVQFAGGMALHVLAVTSPMPAEGKSTVCCHLAAAFAAMGTRTVLVDADLRKPNVHRKFQVPNRTGLTSILRQHLDMNGELKPLGENLSILPAGPAPLNAAELLHLGLAEIIEQLRTQFELVILDCPPVLGFADASIIANLADGYVLVASAGNTEQGLVSASLRQMQDVRATLLGMILNRVSAKTDDYYNYFNQYGEYYHNDELSGEEE